MVAEETIDRKELNLIGNRNEWEYGDSPLTEADWALKTESREI